VEIRRRRWIAGSSLDAGRHWTTAKRFRSTLSISGRAKRRPLHAVVRLLYRRCHRRQVIHMRIE